MLSRFNLLRVTFYLITSVGVSLYSTSASAARMVVFEYGGFRSSLSVRELTDFAETGEAAPALNFYLNRSGQKPESVRKILNQEVNATPVSLDRAMNNPIGEYLLDKIGETIRTPTNRANTQALRSALVESASTDNKVSLIEIIQNYPNSEVHVDGVNLVRTFNQISILADGVETILRIPKTF